MKIKINLKILPLYILLLVGCLRWLFEGVIGGYTCQSVFLIIGLLIFFYANKATLNHMNYEWILFLAGIFVSMIFGSGSMSSSILRRFILVSLIVMFALFCNYKPGCCIGCIRFITIMAIIYAIFIILQYLIGPRFNDVLFPFLKGQSLIVAETYYNNGYTYGIFFTPADPAGLLIFTISFLVLGQVMKIKVYKVSLVTRNSFLQVEQIGTWILVILLVAPLLLTGKRGIVFCGVAAFMVILALHYIDTGQWYKILAIIIALIAIILIFQYLVLAFPDNPLFIRFVKFFEALGRGDIDDSGRGGLYDLAIQQWSNHRIFGIGWRQFSSMTVSAFGYSRAHEVNNEYLQFLCETGIFGTILILIPIVITLRRAIIVCFHYKKDSDFSSDDRYMAFAAAFIQFFVLIYAFIETPFNDMMFFTIYIFSVIVINGCYKQINYPQQKHNKHLNINFEGR